MLNVLLDILLLTCPELISLVLSGEITIVNISLQSGLLHSLLSLTKWKYIFSHFSSRFGYDSFTSAAECNSVGDSITFPASCKRDVYHL